MNSEDLLERNEYAVSKVIIEEYKGGTTRLIIVIDDEAYIEDRPRPQFDELKDFLDGVVDEPQE